MTAGPVRPWRGHGWFAWAVTRQDEPLAGQDAQHGRLRDVHQVQPGPAVGQLAVRPIHCFARINDGEDRVPLGGQDAVHRPTRPSVDQPGAVTSSAPPAAHPLRVHVEHPGRLAGRPAGPLHVVDEGEQAGLTSPCTRGGAFPRVPQLVGTGRARIRGLTCGYAG